MTNPNACGASRDELLALAIEISRHPMTGRNYILADLLSRAEKALRLAASPDHAALAMREALEEIDGMTGHLRQGGPDIMDLQGLSDALERATSLANDALHAAATPLAGVCCSAISPCAHQRSDPTTICDTCRAASEAKSPEPSAEPVVDQQMIDFLEGVVGVVEATSCEYALLWERYSEQYGVSWEGRTSGLFATIGYFDDMPVCVSLRTAEVAGHKLLFIEPTSQVVDHRLVEKWMDAAAPASARRVGDDRINKTDATNFHNVFPSRIEIKTKSTPTTPAKAEPVAAGYRGRAKQLTKFGPDRMSPTFAFELLIEIAGSEPTPAIDRDVVGDIVTERQRQISAEGWTSDHDDGHFDGSLANAAACYAASTRIFKSETLAGRGYEPYQSYSDLWPWDDKWWKPKDRRHDLVRAGALIVAEIERLDLIALLNIHPIGEVS